MNIRFIVSQITSAASQVYGSLWVCSKVKDGVVYYWSDEYEAWVDISNASTYPSRAEAASAHTQGTAQQVHDQTT